MPVTASTDRNPLHAEFYADRACQSRVRILENVRVARDTYRLRFDCPEMARRFTPGQFLMLRMADLNDPLLGRPLALYDTFRDASGEPIGIDVVYATLGKLTRRLANSKPADEFNVWGPLGNGFPPLCYGVRTADLVAGLADFQMAGFDVRLASDDGTVGHHGLVTDVLSGVLEETRGQNRLVVCCGPEPMMEAVAELCRVTETRCIVSLETPMACGIGICFSCVAKVLQPDGNWDWKRTCVEGPIFAARKIVW